MLIKFKYNTEVMTGKLHSTINKGENPFIYKPNSNKMVRTNKNEYIGTWGYFDEYKKLIDSKRFDVETTISPCKSYWVKVHFLSWGVDWYYLIPENQVIEFDV